MIAFHADIPGKIIGKIRIEDKHTLVDIPEQFVDKALAGDHRTTVFVTYNLKEAAQVGQRVAVIVGETLKQVGTPRQVKANPADETVAAFLKELQ